MKTNLFNTNNETRKCMKKIQTTATKNNKIKNIL